MYFFDLIYCLGLCTESCLAIAIYLLCVQLGMLSLQLAISSYRYCYPDAVVFADTCCCSIGMVCSLAEFTHVHTFKVTHMQACIYVHNMYTI